MKYTIDLSTARPNNFIKEDTVSNQDGGKSNLWGAILSSRPFGQSSSYVNDDNCWRALQYGLFFPTLVSIYEHDVPGDPMRHRYTSKVSSSACSPPECGYLDKRCICVPLLGIKIDDRGSISHPNFNCVEYIIQKWDLMHPKCPPTKPCSPDWSHEPIPKNCPPASYTFDIEFYIGGSLVGGDTEQMMRRFDEALLDQMEEKLKDLIENISRRKNMGCDGGPEDLPPEG